MTPVSFQVATGPKLKMLPLSNWGPFPKTVVFQQARTGVKTPSDMYTLIQKAPSTFKNVKQQFVGRTGP